MLANNVQETSVTTGTGSIALDGVPSAEFTTLTSRFIINERMQYSITNSAGLEEHGIGYLSGVATLVRETVQANSSGTTALISFTGSLLVYVADTAQSQALYPPVIASVSGDSDILISPHLTNYVTTYTGRNNRLQLEPYINLHGSAEFTSFAIYVKTASAGAVVRLGIYLIDEATGLPSGVPYMESDDLDCSSTGLVTSAFTNNTSGIAQSVPLPCRFFMGYAAEDATLRVLGVSWITQFRTWRSRNANGAETPIYQAFTLGTPTPGAAALPTIGTLNSSGENHPIGGLVL